MDEKYSNAECMYNQYRGGVLMEEKDDEFLKMIGLTGTKKILDFIYEHGTASTRIFDHS
jgi:hypothetical protein